MDEDNFADWNKLKNNSEKFGFRDGIEEGRSSNFQKSFDSGYKIGFRNGFELGKLKGSLIGTSALVDCSPLENTKRGNCCICKDNKLLKNTDNDKERLQWNSTVKILNDLTRKQ